MSQGTTRQIQLSHELVGTSGWVLLIFAGVDRTSQRVDPSWVASLNSAWSMNLNVVVRIGAGWGSSNYRDESDDAAHLKYTSLGAAYGRIVSQLPVPAGKTLYLQIANEPDLCYEWFCGKPASPLSYTEVAREYAHFLSDVIDAVKARGRGNIKVSLGALAPGGCAQCGCCGKQNCPGDKPGITGLTFLQRLERFVCVFLTFILFFSVLHQHDAECSGDFRQD